MTSWSRRAPRRRRRIGQCGDRAAVAELDPDPTVRALMPVTARMEEVTSQMR